MQKGTSPWVNFDETMHLLGIHGIYDKDDISKWWNEEGVEPNRTAVKINKLRFIISHLNNDFYHCSKKEMNLVMALDKTHDRIIRPGHTMNSKKYRVFAGDAIRMEMLSINKDFCMNS